MSQRVSDKITHAHVITCLSVCCFLTLSSSSHSLAPLYFLSLSTCSLSCSSSKWSKPQRNKTTALTNNEEYCPVTMHNPLTNYEPKQLDTFDYSETSATIFQKESVDIDTEPSYSCDVELDDELIGKALSSPLFTQEREEPANLRQTQMKKVCCQLSPFSHVQVRGDPYTNLVRLRNGNEVAIRKTKESGFSLKDKSKFSLKSELRSRSTNFKPILKDKVSRN